MPSPSPSRPASSGRRLRRAAGLAAAAVLTPVLAPEAASAAGVFEIGRVVNYSAIAGEVNRPLLSIEDGFVQIRETAPGTPLSAGVNCQAVEAQVVRCAGGMGARIVLGDRDDAYLGTGPGGIPTTVLGEDGDDVFVDGPGAKRTETYVGGAGTDTADYASAAAPVALSLNDAADDGEDGEADALAEVEQLMGGPFADQLSGSAAADVLTGGPGDDRLSGLGGADTFREGAEASGADVIAGGSDVDRVSYADRRAAGVRVALDGTANDGEAGEGDNVRADVEDITGTVFADVLRGSDAVNAISGLAGGDTITPLGGSDRAVGDDGDDVIDVRDGVRDVARGGTGHDRIDADAFDDVIA